MSRQCQCGGLVTTHLLTQNREAWSCKSCGRYEAIDAPPAAQLTAPAAEIAKHSETGARIAPDLLAERDRLKAANADLTAALASAVARQGFSNHELMSARAVLANHKKESA